MPLNPIFYTHTSYAVLKKTRDVLKEQLEKMDVYKREMDRVIEFDWRDPVGEKFKRDYAEKIKPFGNIWRNIYSQVVYLNELMKHVEAFYGKDDLSVIQVLSDDHPECQPLPSGDVELGNLLKEDRLSDPGATPLLYEKDNKKVLGRLASAAGGKYEISDNIPASSIGRWSQKEGKMKFSRMFLENKNTRPEDVVYAFIHENRHRQQNPQCYQYYYKKKIRQGLPRYVDYNKCIAGVYGEKLKGKKDLCDGLYNAQYVEKDANKTAREARYYYRKLKKRTQMVGGHT